MLIWCFCNHTHPFASHSLIGRWKSGGGSTEVRPRCVAPSFSWNSVKWFSEEWLQFFFPVAFLNWANINFPFFSLFFPNYSKLGTHGTPKRRGAGHEPPVKSLTYGDVKRPVSGMHSTENVAGKWIFCWKLSDYSDDNWKWKKCMIAIGRLWSHHHFMLTIFGKLWTHVWSRLLWTYIC